MVSIFRCNGNACRRSSGSIWYCIHNVPYFHKIIIAIHLKWECNHAEQILRYIVRGDGEWQALREV